MTAIKGYIDSGRFTPIDGTKLPTYAYAVLVIESIPDQLSPESPPLKAETTKNEWLNQLRQARILAKNDPLPNFVVRQPMREPHGLSD